MIVNRLPIKDVLENLDTKLENETIKRMLRKMATKETRLRLTLTATVDLIVFIIFWGNIGKSACG